ncbi:MAG: hypothetical protein HY695_35920 [Deltaproteobacteria bacterium]|nr:hypothetical protein [Deltaproteobacteria bacterium]
MKLKANSLVIAGFLLALTPLPAMGQTATEDPTQLGSRQLEVRSLDVNCDTAYRSATQALLSLGYSITHSDKTSGILTGSRSVGVTEMKQQVKKSNEEMKQYQEPVKFLA